ncbi:MAG: sulfatase [Halobacteriaceae archaeon]
MATPNVLVLLCDQLAARVLGCYGGPVPTANLDRIAESGVAFADATCPTPVCSPSRASVELGSYPHAHGIRSNVGRRDVPASSNPPTQEGIKADDPTLGRLLADAGYDTHHYGKWHLGDDDLPYFPDPFGPHKEYAQSMADRFREVRARPREAWMDWKGWALPVEQSPEYRDAIAAADWEYPDWGPSNFLRKMGRLELDPQETFDVQVADRAVERVGQAPEPFYVVASFNWPHDPNVVPDPYYGEFDPRDIALPDSYGDCERRFADEPSRRVVEDFGEAGVREFLRIYYGTVSLLDEQVGRLLDALDERGVAEDTVVVFAADHGDMTGGHGMVWKGTTAFYEEVVRVPLLVRGPGVAPRGTVDAPAGLTDLAPTLLEFAGVSVPDSYQGHSLVPFLRGDSEAGPRTFTFAERVASNDLENRTVYRDPLPGSFMVRGEGWKYARYPDEEFLYDLAADPGETADLSGDPAHADRLERMRAELGAWLDRTDYPGDPL